jgi:hypothetical protein
VAEYATKVPTELLADANTSIEHYKLHQGHPLARAMRRRVQRTERHSDAAFLRVLEAVRNEVDEDPPKGGSVDRGHPLVPRLFDMRRQLGQRRFLALDGVYSTAPGVHQVDRLGHDAAQVDGVMVRRGDPVRLPAVHLPKGENGLEDVLQGHATDFGGFQQWCYFAVLIGREHVLQQLQLREEAV